MIARAGLTKITRSYAEHIEYAVRVLSSADDGGGVAGLGCRASGRARQRRRLHLLSREENQREVGALGHVDSVHGLPRGHNTGRYDDLEPVHAEGKDLLRLPREIRRTAAARASGERDLRGLSRRALERPANAAASRGRASAFRAETVSEKTVKPADGYLSGRPISQ